MKAFRNGSGPKGRSRSPKTRRTPGNHETGPTAVARRVALLIGASAYKDQELTPLESPKHDIPELAELLRDPNVGNFSVVRPLIDSKAAEVQREIADFFDSCSEGDTALLYISGHGIVNESGLYFGQVDTELKLAHATSVPADLVRRCLERSRANKQILVLDCCYGGAFSEAPIGEHFSTSARGRWVLAASSADQKSLEGRISSREPCTSFFTHYLIEGLRTGDADSDRDGEITVDEWFDYAKAKTVTRSDIQVPRKSIFNAESNVIIGRAYLPPPLVKDPAPRQLSQLQRALAFGLLLVLNSMLAGLGSLLWNQLPYWPAFLVSALACLHIGGWGVLLALTSPFVSSLMGISAAPPFLYVGSNLIQSAGILLACKALSIDRGLHKWLDQMKYVSSAALLSWTGGALAWYVRHRYDPGNNDPRILVYALWWTAENVLPVVIPGIWLHRVAAEFYAPFDWQSGGIAKSWKRRVVDYASIWMVSLLLFGLVILTLVAQQLHSAHRPDISVVAVWRTLSGLVGQNIIVQWLILLLMVAILASLGLSIRFAKQTWILEKDVSRRSPFFFSEDLPKGRQNVTVVVFGLHGYNDALGRSPANSLLPRLTEFFEIVTNACSRQGGYVDRMDGRTAVVVFGLGKEGPCAREALSCAIDVVENWKSLKEPTVLKLPCHAGVHSCVMYPTEMGAATRQQFVLIGEGIGIANVAMEEALQRLEALVFSHSAANEAGLLVANNGAGVIRELPVVATVKRDGARLFVFHDLKVMLQFRRDAQPIRDRVAET